MREIAAPSLASSSQQPQQPNDQQEKTMSKPMIAQSGPSQPVIQAGPSQPMLVAQGPPQPMIELEAGA